MANKRFCTLHHSAISGNASQYDDIYDYHNRGAPRADGTLKWPTGRGIQYHFVLEKNGFIRSSGTETRTLYHAGDWNVVSIGICVAGDFRFELPTQAQKEGLVRLLEGIQQRWGIPDKNILLHREVRSTACPVIDLREIYFLERARLLADRIKKAALALEKPYVSDTRKSALRRFLERVRGIF